MMIQKLFAANSTQAAHPLGGTCFSITQPVSSTILYVERVQGLGTTNKLLFFGTDADNETFTARIYGYQKDVNVSTQASGWVRTTIAEIACTVSSTLVGVAGYSIINTDMMVDTLVLTTGLAYLEQGMADTTPGTATFDATGYEFWGLSLALGTAATMNAVKIGSVQ